MAYVFNVFTGTFDYTGSSTTSASNVKKAVVTPSPDGVATTFTTPDAYATNTLLVFLNGLTESQITEATSTTFTFSTPPITGDDIHVFYAKQATSATTGIPMGLLLALTYS